MAFLSCGGGGSSGDTGARDTGIPDCNSFFDSARGSYVGRVIDIQGSADRYFAMNQTYQIEIDNPLIKIENTLLGDIIHDFASTSFSSCSEAAGIFQASWSGGTPQRMLSIMYFGAGTDTFTQFLVGFSDDDGRAAFEIN